MRLFGGHKLARNWKNEECSLVPVEFELPMNMQRGAVAVLECIQVCENAAQKRAPDLVAKIMDADEVVLAGGTQTWLILRLSGRAFQINYVQRYHFRPFVPELGRDTRAATW